MRLYPGDTRFAHGREFIADFERGRFAARQRGRLSLLRFVAYELLVLACDVAVDRINTLYSHRTFHGRARPNLGVVRPPNMGKREWFEGASASDDEDCRTSPLRHRSDSSNT